MRKRRGVLILVVSQVGLRYDAKCGLILIGRFLDTLGSLLYRPNAVLGQGLSGLRFPKVVENVADARLVSCFKRCENSTLICARIGIGRSSQSSLRSRHIQMRRISNFTPSSGLNNRLNTRQGIEISRRIHEASEDRHPGMGRQAEVVLG